MTDRLAYATPPQSPKRVTSDPSDQLCLAIDFRQCCIHLKSITKVAAMATTVASMFRLVVTAPCDVLPYGFVPSPGPPTMTEEVGEAFFTVFG